MSSLFNFLTFSLNNINLTLFFLFLLSHVIYLSLTQFSLLPVEYHCTYKLFVRDYMFVHLGVLDLKSSWTIYFPKSSQMTKHQIIFIVSWSSQQLYNGHTIINRHISIFASSHLMREKYLGILWCFHLFWNSSDMSCSKKRMANTASI